MSLKRIISVFCTIVLFASQTSLQEMLHLFFDDEVFAHKYCFEHDQVEHSTNSHGSSAQNTSTSHSGLISTIDSADNHSEDSSAHGLCFQFQTRGQALGKELVYKLSYAAPLVDAFISSFEIRADSSLSIYMLSPSCSPPDEYFLS